MLPFQSFQKLIALIEDADQILSAAEHTLHAQKGTLEGINPEAAAQDLLVELETVVPKMLPVETTTSINCSVAWDLNCPNKTGSPGASMRFIQCSGRAVP